MKIMQEKLLYVIILLQLITAIVQNYNIRSLKKELEERKKDLKK